MPVRSSNRAISLGLLALVTACADVPLPDDSTSITRAATVETTLVARSATWSYWYQGEDLGTAWRAHGWVPAPGGASGAAPLGYGETYVNPIPFGPDPARKPITVYFRREFFVDNPAEVASLRLDVMYDDGFVYYVNGQEGGRGAMPTGTVSFTTRSTGHEANNVYQSLDASSVRGALQAGWNTLAIEIHQADPTSSDLVFDAALVGQVGSAPPPPPPATGGIARGSTWTYWDRGGDLGSAWRAGGFDDSGWTSAAGPLGYGESYLATTVSYGPSASSKYITTYFRKQFTVDDPAAVTAITGEVMYDDGFVVYLNGTRFGSEAMPSGTTTASTLALGHEANGYQAYDWTVQRPLLVAGVNTIAVELHQQSPSSSDLVFDLAVNVQTGGPPPPPPPPPPTGIVRVCASGAPYARIGDAIAAASSGDSIEICPGTYFERLTIAGKPLVLVAGSGPGTVTVDGSAGGRVLDISGTSGNGVLIQGLTFRNGSTSSNGGGIRCTGSTLKMVDSVLRSNLAGNGGGLMASGCVLDILRTRFEQNRAREMGGGALLELSSGQLASSVFFSNRGVNGGGLTVREGSVTIRDSQLHANVAELRGGGLYHDSSSSVLNNTISDNDSGWTGGGIHTVGHVATLMGNVVTGNESVNDGGGIYVHQGTPALLENRFERNHSGDDGGGVRIFESRCRIEGNIIELNTADDTGGGIRVSHLPCQIIGNVVANNHAVNGGGGLDLDNDSSVVRGGQISGNSADVGGGLAIRLGPYNGASIQDVMISENQATKGGGLYIEGNFTPVMLRGVTVINNSAADGGGLWLATTELTVTRSVFQGNSGQLHGGAIYASSSGSLSASIGFIVAYGNSSPSGSAIWTSHANLTLANSILYNNSGGPSVRASGAIPAYRYNDTLPATFNGMTSPVGSSGNISADPLFVSDASDFHLRSGSPCINAGDPAIADSNGSRADMGRFGGP